MKNISVLVFLICSMVLLVACNGGDKQIAVTDKVETAANQEGHKQAILDMYAAWNKAVEAGDRDGYLGWDIEFLDEDTAQVRYDYIVDITMKGDVDTITDSEAALSQMSNNLKYNDVVKRDASGDWKVLRHMWNAGYERN